MSESQDVDYQTFMKPRSAKMLDWFAGCFSFVTHRGWVDVDAEVTECIRIRSKGDFIDSNKLRSGSFSSMNSTTQWGGYVVSFIYKVNGMKYQGFTTSSDQFKQGDSFPLRYNPSNPEQNNTFNSETNWTAIYTKFLGLILGLMLFYFLARKLFFKD